MASGGPEPAVVHPFGEPKRLITRNGAGAGPAAARVSRIPSGHPEGYLEGFANVYAEAARAIRARQAGEPLAEDVVFPTVEDGLGACASSTPACAPRPGTGAS